MFWPSSSKNEVMYEKCSSRILNQKAMFKRTRHTLSRYRMALSHPSMAQPLSIFAKDG